MDIARSLLAKEDLEDAFEIAFLEALLVEIQDLERLFPHLGLRNQVIVQRDIYARVWRKYCRFISPFQTRFIR